ncbi:MAG TPA: hypothetical protein VNZ57_12090 [Longimicrobiales bacterium]|nr:hypothetical protein [Longimicrobiales bacterium]
MAPTSTTRPAIRCRSWMLPVTALLVLLAVLPSPGLAQRPVVSAERLRTLPTVQAEQAVTVLRDGGVDTAVVRPDGVALEVGTMLVLPTGEALREVTGPRVPAEIAPSPPDPEGSSGAAGGAVVTATPGAEVDTPFRALPFRLLTPDATGSGIWTLRPVIKVDRPLRWDPATGEFRGRLAIAVNDSLSPSEAKPLPTTVGFRFLGDADGIAPERVEVSRTNDLYFVELHTRAAIDSLRLHIVPDFDLSGHDVWIPVRPTLVVTAPPRVPGWGVGSAPITVLVRGGADEQRASATLAATMGELDAQILELGAAGSAITTIRSSGIGTAVITASAPGFGEAVATVEFTWPVAFLLAGLLGSVFGGAVVTVRQRDRRIRLRHQILGAVLGGLLGTVAWFALGINMLGVDLGLPRSNEIAVFAVAALGAYLGIMAAPKSTDQDAT